MSLSQSPIVNGSRKQKPKKSRWVKAKREQTKEKQVANSSGNVFRKTVKRSKSACNTCQAENDTNDPVFSADSCPGSSSSFFVSSIVLFIFIFSAIEITECLHVSFTRLVGRGILSTTHTRASVYTSISQFTIGKEPKSKKEKELSFVCVCGLFPISLRRPPFIRRKTGLVSGVYLVPLQWLNRKTTDNANTFPASL